VLRSWIENSHYSLLRDSEVIFYKSTVDNIGRVSKSHP
jgi:hypothetical protein